MIVFDGIEKSKPCSSCGAVAFSVIVFGGDKEIYMCEFCKQVLLDMLEEDLDI